MTDRPLPQRLPPALVERLARALAEALKERLDAQRRLDRLRKVGGDG